MHLDLESLINVFIFGTLAAPYSAITIKTLLVSEAECTILELLKKNQKLKSLTNV